ncbi:MAG: hypothetical protein RQ729_03815 [Wenzhouxiangellaceae bacterium]|nr:hypothetical protein [Wenzhouxiangellaceae bacterium]
MSWHCLVFEANSIQSWVFGSGRLRHIVGGSRLVSGLTDELLDSVLAGLGLEAGRDMLFPRRGGGAFYAFSEDAEAIERLAQCWPLFVARYAPGLGFSLGRGEGDGPRAAFVAARAALQRTGKRPWPVLPQATPVMERAPRTGRPAVARHRKDVLDETSRAQERAEAIARANAHEDIEPGMRLARRLERGTNIWPRDMEPDESPTGSDAAFPFRRDEQGALASRYVALVHADGNGLGQVLQQLQAVGSDGAEYLSLFRRFSDALDQATLEAAARACQAHLINDPDTCDFETLPARPIILGGDDLTFLVRADLALPFTRSFLEAFEQETASRLKTLGVAGLERGLTACAGLAYLRANQPFHMGVQLAESLCAHAKAQVRQGVNGGPMVSALALHRCTDSLIEDYEQLLHSSLTIADHAGAQSYRLTMEAWALHSGDAGLPPLDALVGLLAWLNHKQIARGPGRQLLGLMGLSPGLARVRYRRWLEILEKRDGQSGSRLAEEFSGLLKAAACGARVLEDLPFVERQERLFATPLGDAMALKSLLCRSAEVQA